VEGDWEKIVGIVKGRRSERMMRMLMMLTFLARPRLPSMKGVIFWI